MKMDTVHSSKPYATEDEQKKISDAMPHVVIVGAGFGGLEAAKRLRKVPIKVTVIDRTNHPALFLRHGQTTWNVGQ